METFETITRYAAGIGFIALGAFFLVIAVCRAFAPVVRRMRRRGRLEAAFLFALFSAAAYYGGSKGFYGRVEYPRTDADVQYLVDGGSYVTNDMVHIDFTRVAALPDTADLQGWYRPLASTNDADWVQFLDTTFAAFTVPCDIAIENATNYVFQLFTTWTPGPAVHTNGIAIVGWSMPSAPTNSAATLVMARTDVRYKPRLPYDAEVEYLESTGGQNIDTGIYHETVNAVRFKIRMPNEGGNWYASYRGYVDENSATTRIINYFGKLGQLFLYHGAKAGGGGTYFNRPSDSILEGWTAPGVFSINGVTGALNQPIASRIGASFKLLDSGVRGERLYYFAVDNQCDFIPVRFTNERGETEGAMYDRVSGELFRNQGTGAFVIGPDK